MATIADIKLVRVNTQETENVEPYTDDFISSLVDAVGVTETEHKIWIAKRNTMAALVDISEGGSARKNSQIFEAYSKIVLGYEQGDADANGRRPPRTRAAVRG